MKGDNKPVPLSILQAKDIERFWTLVDRRGPDECWPWKGPRFPGYFPKGKRYFKEGYARFYVTRDGKCYSLRAHRVALFLVTGKDPGDLFSCHSCDNVICCNGLHMFPGTQQDNMDDCVSKGRQATGDDAGPRKWITSRPRGEAHYFSKVNYASVSLILSIGRDAIAAGRALPGRKLPKGLVPSIKASHPEIDLCTAHIARILRRQIWQYVPMPADSLAA